MEAVSDEAVSDEAVSDEAVSDEAVSDEAVYHIISEFVIVRVNVLQLLHV